MAHSLHPSSYPFLMHRISVTVPAKREVMWLGIAVYAPDF